MKVDVPIEVRYAETDAMGIVYHANYLVWFEVARTRFLEAIGFPYTAIEEAGCLSPVVDMQVSYGIPFKYGETAVVRVGIEKTNQTKTVYTYEVYLQGEENSGKKPRVTGKSIHCIVDKDTFRPQSIKRSFPELYQRYLEVIEEDSAQ
ncbi:MAG: acyl-CoA thioesterase [Anaerotardibacter sp.]